MDKTFAELKKENKVLRAEYENLKNNLDKVQSKLKSAGEDVDEVFLRQRVMAKKLRDVEAVEYIETDAEIQET